MAAVASWLAYTLAGSGIGVAIALAIDEVQLFLRRRA